MSEIVHMSTFIWEGTIESKKKLIKFLEVNHIDQDKIYFQDCDYNKKGEALTEESLLYINSLGGYVEPNTKFGYLIEYDRIINLS